MQPGELIKIIRIPRPVAPVTAFHKIAKRRFDDISSVAVAYAMTVTDGTVEAITIGLGGVAATPMRALATEAALTGTAVDAGDRASRRPRCWASEGTPMSDHRASANYRAATLRTSLLKFFAANPAARQEVRA